MFTFSCSVPNLALSPDPECVLQRVVGFAIVQPDLNSGLYARVQYPVDHEQRALDPADFAQC